MLFISYPSHIENEAPMQLKRFEKLHLRPQESRRARLILTQRDMSTWHVGRHAWVREYGVFTVYFGSNVADIKYSQPLTMAP